MPPEFDIGHYFRFVDRQMLKMPVDHPACIPTWKWETIIALFRDTD